MNKQTTIALVLLAVAGVIVALYDEIKSKLLIAAAAFGICSSCTRSSPGPKQTAGTIITNAPSDTATIVNVDQVPEVDVSNPNATCEIFTNHGPLIPHLYANNRANELVGTVFAKSQPEFNAYGSWIKMQPLGTSFHDPSLKGWAYRILHQYNTNVSLRTREGCGSTADARNTGVNNYNGMEDEMPSSVPIFNHENLNLVVNFAGNLEEDKSNYDIWETLVAGHHSNLQFRVNNGAWRATQLKTIDPSSAGSRELIHTALPHFQAGKDFIIDFTKNNGTTIDRYRVSRNNTGGHFSANCTMVREEDGRVYVSTYQGDRFLPMKLGNWNYKTWGTFFDLGYLQGGTYYYPLKSIETGYILDNALAVTVR